MRERALKIATKKTENNNENIIRDNLSGATYSCWSSTQQKKSLTYGERAKKKTNTGYPNSGVSVFSPLSLPDIAIYYLLTSPYRNASICPKMRLISTKNADTSPSHVLQLHLQVSLWQPAVRSPPSPPVRCSPSPPVLWGIWSQVAPRLNNAGPVDAVNAMKQLKEQRVVYGHYK